MADKPNVIENRTHGFSERDIEQCEDLHQLRRWLNAAKKDRDILEGKVEYEEAKEDKNRQRIVSLRSAKRLQNILADIIKQRITELMDNSKELYQFELNFYEQARKAVYRGEMNEELFNKLIENAQGYAKV
jgi:hypothetical protein